MARETSGMEVIGAIILIVAWIGGVVLAKGFWLTALAFLVPPVGWIFFIKRLMEMTGMIQ